MLSLTRTPIRFEAIRLSLKECEGKQTALVIATWENLATLDPGKWLGDAIIEYCLWKACDAYFGASEHLIDEWAPGNGMAKGSRETITNFSVLNTYVLAMALRDQPLTPRETHYGLVGGCGNLTAPFLLIPMNWENAHWVLCIVCFANSMNEPCMLFLDSCRNPANTAAAERYAEAIRKYLNSFPNRCYTKENLPLIFASVPSQPNSFDCGLYMLMFATCFLNSPDKHSLVSRLRALEDEFGWCPRELPVTIRATLLDGMQKLLATYMVNLWTGKSKNVVTAAIIDRRQGTRCSETGSWITVTFDVKTFS